jgi:hypothetical protein
MEYRMSRLVVSQIQGDAVNKEIEIPAGHKLKSSEAGAIVQPGSVVNSAHIFLGAGSSNYTTTDPSFGNHTSVTTPSTGYDADGDGAWENHVVSLTTTTPTATDFEIDITPKFTNSIMKIEHNPHIYSGATSDNLAIRIVRTISGGTPTVIYQPQTNGTSAYGLWYGGATYFQPTIVAFDKPATTSSVNYKIYIYTYSGNTHYYGGHQGGGQYAPKQYLAVYEIAQ